MVHPADRAGAAVDPEFQPAAASCRSRPWRLESGPQPRIRPIRFDDEPIGPGRRPRIVDGRFGDSPRRADIGRGRAGCFARGSLSRSGGEKQERGKQVSVSLAAIAPA